MPFLNKKLQIKNSYSKNALAYLTALTLLFSYAEMMLPRFIPFFRLGLANTVILLALDINFTSFILLSILKALAASLMGGTLFSPFFLISLAQSLLSALLMRSLHKFISRRLLGIYGISIAGAALSALIQIELASLYLGNGTQSLLGPMLLFNTASGIITAFISENPILKKDIKNLTSKIERSNFDTKTDITGDRKKTNAIQLIYALLICGFSILIFFIKNQLALAIALLLSLLAQRLCKRKIYFLPHISLWLFIFISSIFMPNGKVLFKLANFSITQGALALALQKALTLSTISALSQCAVCLKPGKDSLLALSLSFYKTMSDRFRNSKGSIIKRFSYALNITDEEAFPQTQTDTIPQ